jgi:hypothetical protein
MRQREYSVDTEGKGGSEAWPGDAGCEGEFGLDGDEIWTGDELPGTKVSRGGLFDVLEGLGPWASFEWDLLYGMFRPGDLDMGEVLTYA